MVGLHPALAPEPGGQVVGSQPFFIEVEVQIVKHSEVEATAFSQLRFFELILLLDLLRMLSLKAVDLGTDGFVVAGFIV